MMFRHLLVPLDGSRLAEAVLPVVVRLARALGARVTLQHVVEPAPPATVHGEAHLKGEAEARAYLEQVAAQLAGEDVAATVRVDQGADVATSIARRAAQSGADLIMLCRHGSGGMRALLYGRVAEQVLARGTTPVLLMPAVGPREQPFALRRVLVSLDGSEMAEAALGPAADLARAAAAAVLLVMAVPTVATITDDRAAAARLMPTAGAALLDAEAAQAAAYLDRVRQRLVREQVAAVAQVERGEPARVLLDLLARPGIDLMVMATHGRSGVSAVWAGSVASRIAAQAARPVLLIRMPRAG
jgi:nucleotide-binding universal stress UspA family protein